MLSLLQSAALALSAASYALAQSTTASLNPLNEFIGVAGSAASVINSAHAKETAAAASLSSASATAMAASASSSSAAAKAAAAAKPNNSHRNMIIAVVCGIVGAVLLLALLLCICCVLRRHGRRRRSRKAVHDDEKTVHHTQPTPPLNPGRTYTPLAQNRGVPITSTSPIIPVAATAGPLNLNHDPSRGNQNPFVPVPPSPRKPAYSNTAFINPTPRHSTDYSYTAHPHESYATHPHESYRTAQPYLVDTSPRQTPAPRSRSNSRPSSRVGLAATQIAEEPPTPLGMNRIGQPYDDRHVAVLRAESPSSDLRRSLYDSDPVRRHHTPPLLPSRSPARHFPPTAGTGYQSSTDNSSSTSNSASDEDWRRSHGGTSSSATGWTGTPTRYSNGTSGTVLPAPPVPWDHRQSRRHSGGDDPPRSPGGGWTASHDRRGSGTSINGQPRRTRFSDLSANDVHSNVGGSGPNHVRDDHRNPRVVMGEAL